MDTSETYVKMCEKAGEIQELRPHLWGDFRYNSILNKKEIIYSESSMDDQEIYTWLPRQDQLQEMVFDELRLLPGEVQLLYEFVKKDGYIRCETWEQLWLAFVMKEKYGKVWNGEDWVAKS